MATTFRILLIPVFAITLMLSACETRTLPWDNTPDDRKEHPGDTDPDGPAGNCNPEITLSDYTGERDWNTPASPNPDKPDPDKPDDTNPDNPEPDNPDINISTAEYTEETSWN